MQPSWEQKMLEDQQRTNELLDEIGYSEGQRQVDEMVLGDRAFEDEPALRPLPGQPHSLLGSPYRSGFGGHVYGFFYYAIGVCVIALIALAIHTCAKLTSPPAQGGNTPAAPGGISAPQSSGGP